MMDMVFENPGLCHIREKIFNNLNIQTKLSCRLVKKSWNDEFEKQASKTDLLKVPHWTKFLKEPHSYLQNLFSQVINSSEEFNHRTPFLAFAATGNSKIVTFILHTKKNSIRDCPETNVTGKIDICK